MSVSKRSNNKRDGFIFLGNELSAVEHFLGAKRHGDFLATNWQMIGDWIFDDMHKA